MTDRERSAAADAATEESELWASLIDAEPDGWDDVAPTEVETVGFFDPADDLGRRAAQWSHTLPDHRLGSLVAFAAGLAVAEAAAWRADEAHIATKAFEGRRFLISDRVIHWAVPWLDALAVEYPDHHDAALTHREVLLELGDRLRVAPALQDSAGLAPEGHDAFGPVAPPGPLGTVRTGLILLRPSRGSMPFDERTAGETGLAAVLAELHEGAASRWRGLAWMHPGTAQLWTDLANRAEASASRLRDL